MGWKKTMQVFGNLVHRVMVVLGAMVLTVVFFLLLPVLQAISPAPKADLVVRAVDTGELPPPPPPPPEEQPPEEEEPEPEQPKLEESAPTPSLDDLELMLNPGAGGGWMDGGVSFNLGDMFAGAAATDSMFGLDDLDQKPKALHQPPPLINGKMRKKMAQEPGKVIVIFVVNEAGRVENPKVESSSDPIFERAALAAVKQWKFEPGQRNGQPVSFNMRCPLTF